MATKFTPKPRPTNLPVATIVPQTKPPIPVDGDPSDGPTFAWLEAVRDHYEKNGELLSVDGMKQFARDMEDKGLLKQIDKFYGTEGKSPPAKSVKVAPTPKAKTKAGKKDSAMATTTKPAPTKGKNGKSAPVKGKNGNGKGHPGKNGGGKPPVKKAAVKATPAPTGKVLLEKTNNGLDMLVKSVNGSFRGTANGYPLRGILRFFGAKGWTAGEARDAVAKILKGWKGGEDYAAAMVEEGHVGSGAKEANGETGSFGPAPDIDKATAKATLAL